MAKKNKQNTTVNTVTSNTKPSATVPINIEYLVMDSFWKNHWWKVLVLGAVSFFIYYQSINYGYVLDDAIVIEDNKYTKKGFDGIDSLFFTESMTGYFGEQKNLVQGNRYRPLSLMTFAVEYGLMKSMNMVSSNVNLKDQNRDKSKDYLQPGVSHFINILLYFFSCMIIMRCIQLLIPSNQKWFHILDFGFIVALLYAVHPLHVEAVANIKGRDEIMAMMFSCTALYFLVKYYMYGGNKWSLYIGLFSFFLGLLSKENTITFVAVIPLSFYFFGLKNNAVSKSFLWLLAITFIYLMMRFSISGIPQFGQKINDLMNNPFLEMSGSEKLATIIYTLLLYIKLLFIPYPLTHDYYPYAIPIMKWTNWQVWLSILIYGGLIWYSFKKWKEKETIAYGILFYLITLTIVSNIVINLGTFMNDRFIYMSSLGFCIAMVALIWKYTKQPISMAIAGIFIVTFTVLSFLRVPDWKDAMSLNVSAMKLSSESARANTFMSTALFETYKKEKDTNKKMDLLRRALPFAMKSAKITPKYFNANLMVAGIGGEMYTNTHNLDTLMNTFELAILNRPDVPFITEYLKYLNQLNPDRPKLIDFYVKIGKTLNQNKSIDSYKWSIHYMQIGLQLDPTNKAMNMIVAEAFQALGDQNQANQYLQRASQ